MRGAVLIFSIFFLSVQKVSATTTIRMLPSIVYTQLNGTFTINVVVENIIDLMAGDIKLSFDKDEIQVEQITEGKPFLEKNGGTAFFAAKDINNGSITITFAIMGGSPSGVSGTGTIFSVSFKTIHGTPTTGITFSQVDFRSTNLQNILIPPENQIPSQTLLVPSLHHYRLVTSPPPIIAGQSFDLTIFAEDINNKLVTTYHGTATLSVDKGTITPTQVSNFVAGVATISLTFEKAGLITITARDLGEPAKLWTISLIVLHGTLSKVIITPEQTLPLTPTITFQFNANAYDKFQNEILGCTFLWNVVAGGGMITNTGIFTAGTRAGTYFIKATTGDISGYATVTITSAGLDHFIFDRISDQEAGRTFYLTMTAKDIYGNTVVNYTGVNSLEDTTFTINPKTTSNFSAGVLKDFPVTITFAQRDIKITTRGSEKTGISNPFTISPASDLHCFRFVFPIRGQHTNAPFTINIKAEDKYGNINPYSGTARLTDTTETIQPAEIKFNNGIWNGQVTILSQLGYPDVEIVVHGVGRVGTSTPFSVLIDRTKEVMITHLVRSTLHILPYAISEDYYLIITPNPTSPEINNANLRDDMDRVFDRVENSCVEYRGFNRQKLPITDSFKNSVTLTINYVDNPTIDEATLKICELKNQDWVNIDNSEAETIRNRVTATIPRFGTYILKGATILPVHKFIINPIKDQRVNEPFSIQVIAQDEFGRVSTHFQGTATISDATGILTTIGPFKNGVGSASVTIRQSGLARQISVQKDSIREVSNPFGVLLPKDKKYYQEKDDVRIEMEAYSLPEDYILEIDQFLPQDDFAIILANDKFNRDPTIQQIDKSVHKFTSLNLKQELDLTKKAQTSITFSYNDTELGRIDETKLKIYCLDWEKREWIEIPSRIYPSINKVTAVISQMGVYILAGPVIADNFNDFVVFPNPFKIDRDGSMIEFAGLPKEVTIRIYDISGNLIEYVENQSANWPWKVKNEVDSGIYIYVITDKEGNKIMGKIGVIR